jgi:hypothetical protein
MSAREVDVGVGRRELRRHRVDVLPARPIGEMPARTIVPAEQLRPPGDGAMHHCALRFVPHGVDRDIECRHRGIDERVGRIDYDLVAQRPKMPVGLGEQRRQFVDPVGRPQLHLRRAAVHARPLGRDLAVGGQLFGRCRPFSHALERQEQGRNSRQRHPAGRG